MATQVKVPRLGESVTQAILVKWLKKDGDGVAKDESLCELETDKANVDLPSPAAGVFRRLKDEGETVAVDEVIATVNESATAGASTAPATTTPAAPSAPATAGTSAAPTAPAAPTMAPEDLSPAVRVLVQENHLDAAALAKIAPGGRLTKEFVLAHLQARGTGVDGDADAPSKGAPQPERTPTVASAGAAVTAPLPAGVGAPVAPVAPPKGAGASERLPIDLNAPPRDFDANGERRVKMSKIRQAIARTLVSAQQTAAILTTFNEVDLTEVMSLRAKYKDVFEKAHGVGLGFMSFFARAVSVGLRQFPRLNASLDGDEIIYHQHVNLGIAVSTDRGLAVPVLHQVEAMSFARVESEIKRLAAGVRDNKLAIKELSGGTFSITNGGVFGSLLSTPILTPPQSAILGMHTIQKRPVAINDKVEIRPMMYLALSYDHRIVDGKESISFLVRVKQLLEDPARLMLDV